jgi:hypothetical protein
MGGTPKPAYLILERQKQAFWATLQERLRAAVESLRVSTGASLPASLPGCLTCGSDRHMLPPIVG